MLHLASERRFSAASVECRKSPAQSSELWFGEGFEFKSGTRRFENAERPFDFLSLPTGGRPSQRQVFDPGRVGGRQQVFKRFQDDLSLQLAVKGDAEQMPHHEGEKNRPRGFDSLGHVTGDTGGDRWDSPPLYGALDQRDRLVADWSGRRQQNRVRL